MEAPGTAAADNYCWRMSPSCHLLILCVRQRHFGCGLQRVFLRSSGKTRRSCVATPKEMADIVNLACPFFPFTLHPSSQDIP